MKTSRSDIKKLFREYYPNLRRPLYSFCMSPSFLIIGAQKSGTTSLFRYLTQHSSIVPPVNNKELHYFDINYNKGAKWYRSFFHFNRKGIITGEKSPYYLFHPLAPKRIYDYNNCMIIIALLRDPVLRAYSHYNNEVSKGREKRPFREALEKEAHTVDKDHHRLANNEIDYSFIHQRYSYIARGFYTDQLDLWRNYFSSEHIYIETAEKFFYDPKKVCKDIFTLLEVPYEKIQIPKVYNKGKYDPMDKSDKQWLAGIFYDSNCKLSKYYDLDIGFWT